MARPIYLYVIVTVISTILLSIISLASVHAATYRWVDNNGVVNYSERKPRGIPENRVTVVESSPQNPSSAPIANNQASPSMSSVTDSVSKPATERNLGPEQQAMLKQLEDAEAARQVQVEKLRSDNCTRAKRILDNLSNSGRIRIVDEEGNVRVLPEDERRQHIAGAHQGIATNCDS